MKKAAASTAAAKTAAAKKAADADAGRAAAVKKASTTAAAAKSTSRATAAQSAAAKAAAAKRSEAAKKAAATVRARKAAAAKAALEEAALEEAMGAEASAPDAGAVETRSGVNATVSKTTPAKRTTAKATPAKRTAAKAASAKSTTAKAASAKTTSAKATTAKATAAAEKGSAAKTAAGEKATARSTAARKSTAAKRTPAKATAAKKSATRATRDLADAPVIDGVITPLMPEVTTDVVVALDSEPARRMVAASNSADLAEARPPRRSTPASATIVDDHAADAPVAPVSDSPAAVVQGDHVPDTDATASEVAEAGVPADGASGITTADPTTAEPDAAEMPEVGGAVTGAPADAAERVQVAAEIAAAPAVDLPALDDAVVAAEPAVAGELSREAIRIRGLVKRFGDTNAVDGVDLTVPAGSFYGLVGPNGAGKTTTLSIIAGLLRPDAGSVHISGIDQREKPLEAKRVMGVLPDRLRTFDRLTGRQLLHYYGQLRGLDRAGIEKRTADLARAFDLSEALSRVVSDYSAGMTKKVMLAGALIHSPRVLVLDEPFEAVDPVSSGVILDILRSYVSHGGTVILSSHGMDLVERVCSRVAVIVGGEVLAEGTIDEVRAGQTLTERFIELSGTGGEVEGLEWLHTFSD